MTDDDGTLLLVLGLAVAWYLWQKPAATTTTITTGYTPGPPKPADCDGCGGAGTNPVTPQPGPKPVPQPFCYGGQILREGVCINPTSDTPRLGSANNDAVLAEIIRQQEAAMAQGNWDLAWQIAAKRDAWVKSQGY